MSKVSIWIMSSGTRTEQVLGLRIVQGRQDFRVCQRYTVARAPFFGSIHQRLVQLWARLPKLVRDFIGN